jgi:excisionase family DNA binding protein
MTGNPDTNSARLRDRLPRQLITIDDLSSLWSVPRATLYNWVNQGRLPHVKLGRCLRFDLVEIDEYRRQATMSVAGRR